MPNAGELSTPMKTTTLLILADLERRIQKGKKQMSKLTDAIDKLKADVVDLKTRAAADKAADAATIAALQAENDQAAADLAALSTDVAGIDAPVAVATPAALPPDTTTLTA